MKLARPSDRVDVLKSVTALSERARRELILMRREAGAIELRVTVSARPAGSAAWRPVRGLNRMYRVYSAFNAEQIILGGPLAGAHFTMTRALLEFYEQQHLQPGGTATP